MTQAEEALERDLGTRSASRTARAARSSPGSGAERADAPGRRRPPASNPRTATLVKPRRAIPGAPDALAARGTRATSASVATPSERPAAATRYDGALLVAPVLLASARRDGPLGQVVDALEAAPLAADDLADVEQPLGGDLGLGPVPPRTALLAPPGRWRSEGPRRAGAPRPRRTSGPRSAKRASASPWPAGPGA